MSVIRYSVKFKRPLFVKTPKGQATVGEVQNFQQNLDGSLDIIAFIYPQVPERLRKEIEKNPGMMGMTAETVLEPGHEVFPDGTEFEAVDAPCDHEFVSTYKIDGEANKTRICVKCLQHT